MDVNCRWWALLTLCGAKIESVAKLLHFSAAQTKELLEIKRLYVLGPATDKTHLKQNLRNTFVHCDTVLDTFQAISAAFGKSVTLYEEIVRKKEPYCINQLAISRELLQLEGIPARKCDKILHGLLSVVIKNPDYNNTGQLLTVAKGLRLFL